MTRASIPSIICYLGLLCPTLVIGQDDVRLARLPPIDGSTTQPGTMTQDPLAASAPAEMADPPGEIPPDLELSVEEIPESDVWYEWLTPPVWHLPSVWDASFELGVDGTNGNTQTFTFRGGANLQRKVDWSDLQVDLTYVRGSNDSIQTKHNAHLGVGHDWIFGDGPWSLFAKMQLEYDEFRAFDLRLALNSGVGYLLINHEATTLKARAGAGTSHEFNGPDDRWVPEAVFGMEFEHQLTDRQKLKATVEYFPTWDNFSDFRLTTDAGWQVLLDEATNMSLKLGLLDRYDSTPNGLRPNDLDYSLLLLWEL